jgi:hypothetical protein
MSPSPVIASAASRQVPLADRRNTRRYPIGLDLLWSIHRGKQVIKMGVARTLDISSSGVAFYFGRSLPPGAFVELSLNWPCLLQDSCPLQLIVVGRVVRSDEHATAVMTIRYEFRTRGNRSLRQPPPADENRSNIA